jgi:hypothetical protein
MPSILNDAWNWLNHAEEARQAAEQLTDRDAKEVMLQLGQLYLRLAQTALAQARAREGESACAPRLGTLQPPQHRYCLARTLVDAGCDCQLTM